jgi:hypothetical protein
MNALKSGIDAKSQIIRAASALRYRNRPEAAPVC